MPYIDTKYLGECETCRHHSNSGCNTYCDHGEEYSPNLSKIPTADVEEVVRCKDCRHCEIIIDQFDNDWYFCKNAVNNAKVEADDFCSYGERKEE